MKNIDKLRRTKPESSWVQWLPLIAACFSGVAFIVSLVAKNPSHMAFNGTMLALMWIFASSGSQKKINQELLEEIDILKNDLELLRGQDADEE